MAKKRSALQLGIFIFIGIAILVLTIFLIGDKKSLFSSTFEVNAYFKDIQGLRSGATVRFSGIDVGRVSNVKIVNDNSGKVQVTMSLVEDIKRFIKTDTQASIETEGLVGNKVVVLQIGSENGEPVGNKGTIQSKEPLGFSAIIEQTKGVMEYTKEMTKNLSEIIGRVNRGEGSIGKLLADEQLYNDATQLTKRADQSLQSITEEVQSLTVLFDKLGNGVETVVNNVNTVVTDIDTIVAGVRDGKGLMGELFVKGSKLDTTFSSAMKNIERTTYDARNAASSLSENMEALKHNWLFKSYFEERGYWDKAKYEDEIDDKINQLNEKIKMIDERISTLKSLENTNSK